jgi:hypothetical protein
MFVLDAVNNSPQRVAYARLRREKFLLEEQPLSLIYPKSLLRHARLLQSGLGISWLSASCRSEMNFLPGARYDRSTWQF